MKWSEAQFSCEQQEAQLATIANPLEQGRASPWGGPSILYHSPPKWREQSRQGAVLLLTILSPVAFITASLPNVTFDLWIGLHASQRDFQWVEQESLLYTNWAPGEPSGPSPAPSGNIPVRNALPALPSTPTALACSPCLHPQGPCLFQPLCS